MPTNSEVKALVASSVQDGTKTQDLIIGLYTSIGLLGVIANVLLLLVARSHAKLRLRSVVGGGGGVIGGVYVHYGVAGFDLAFLVVNLPMQLINYLYYDQWATDFVVFGDDFHVEFNYASASCKAFHYIPAVVYGSHVLFLVGLGFERLYVAVFPLSAAARQPAGLMFINVIGSVALALVMALPQLVVSDTQLRRFYKISDRNDTYAINYRCGNVWSNTSDLGSRELTFRVYVQTAYVWLPIALVQFCYTTLLLHLGRRESAIGVSKVADDKTNAIEQGGKKVESSSSVISSSRTRNIRLNLTVGLTTAVFFACWAPFSVANLVSTASDPLREYLRLFGYSSAALNPCVYAFLNPAQRAHLKRLLAGLVLRFTSLLSGCSFCRNSEKDVSETSESRSAPPPQAPMQSSDKSCQLCVGALPNLSSEEFKQRLMQQMQQVQQNQAGQEHQEQRRVIVRRDTRSTRVGAPGGGTTDR